MRSKLRKNLEGNVFEQVGLKTWSLITKRGRIGGATKNKEIRQLMKEKTGGWEEGGVGWGERRKRRENLGHSNDQ